MKTVDKFEELLKIQILESTNPGDEDFVARAMQAIMNDEVSVHLDAVKENQLITRLKARLSELSFGQLLRERLASSNETEKSLAEKTRIPEAVIVNLLDDAIFTNNVPIRMMSNLLGVLKISFDQAEAAMFSTFERLKSALSDSPSLFSSFTTSVAFRKGSMLSQSTLPTNTPTDGKELFENREVLEKYLKRLRELSA
jgi:hypothetical protein